MPTDAAGHRAYAILTLVPEAPIFTWMMELDTLLARLLPDGTPPGLPIVLDLAKTPLHGPGLRALMEDMRSRDLRVIALTGLDPTPAEGTGNLPPILTQSGEAAPVAAPPPPPPKPESQKPETPPAKSMIVEGPIRSGQRITNPNGDIAILGAVGNGAEVIASGSIHIYGPLRGRAIAGTTGAIFCQKLEAELLMIANTPLTAEDMPAAMIGKAVCASISDGTVQLSLIR